MYPYQLLSAHVILPLTTLADNSSPNEKEVFSHKKKNFLQKKKKFFAKEKKFLQKQKIKIYQRWWYRHDTKQSPWCRPILLFMYAV